MAVLECSINLKYVCRTIVQQCIRISECIHYNINIT